MIVVSGRWPLGTASWTRLYQSTMVDKGVSQSHHSHFRVYISDNRIPESVHEVGNKQ